MSPSKSAPRTYNQVHVPRKYTPGQRRVSIYIAWSYPAEANRDVNELDNRYSTMNEVRRVSWPKFEPLAADPHLFLQGIAGSLELFFRAWIPFQQFVEEKTGHAVPVFQRIDHAGYRQTINDQILEDCDTLMVFGLDHTVTGQEAAPEEIDALKRFLSREGTSVVIGPHHDIGESDDESTQEMEHRHHRDALVPRRQRFGGYTRSLMKGLEIPIENRYGLRPHRDKTTKEMTPLSINHDVDTRGYFTGVTTFNYHMHMPHYAVTTESAKSVHVLAKQPIDMSRPHPFIEAGNREFNAFIWLPPDGTRAGDVLMVDSTIFSTLFGADESLKRFWQNIVK